MSWSLKLLSVRGIDIKVHFSFILILIWAAYRWGIALDGGTSGALFGIVVTLILFACVTLHELAHSFTAMSYGVKVRDITLWPIGGLAQMEKVPEKPAQELKMSLAGPLTNLAIAAVLILLTLPFGGQVSLRTLVNSANAVSWQGLLSYVIFSNIALAVFNLLPAFPMDGGRVLRSLLALKLDYTRATAWAVTIGQAFAWLLGLFGVLGGGWTLVIIAIFIYLGASQEGRMIEVKGVLGQIKVRQAMTRQLQTLTPQMQVSHAIALILNGFQSDFPVVDGERLVGLLTEVDLLNALQRREGDSFPPEQRLVREIMRREFPTAGSEEPLFEAQQRMNEGRVRAMPVLADGQLVGLLTAQDINEAYRLLSINPRLIEMRSM